MSTSTSIVSLAADLVVFLAAASFLLVLVLRSDLLGVTGTIDADGNVGQVGGVAQKTVTARKAGAIAFLVPPEEEKEAKRFAGKMQIIPVKTLGDALAALHRLGGSEVAAPIGAAAPHS